MAKKIGRNDKCPCRSGSKYKKCCLDKGIVHNSNKAKAGRDIDKNTIISVLKSISKSKKIQEEDGNGFYRIFWDDNIEKVDPVKYYKQYELQKRAISYRDILEAKEPALTAELSNDFFVRFAEEKIEEERFWQIKEETEVPKNFLKLFETTRKKGQESLLKGLSINPDQLISLIFKSFKDYRYLYSRYRFENLPKGLDEKKKPIVAHISDNSVVKTIGETDLTKGQVKSMIEQRKVIIAHFFDRDDDWHCLFTTYNSLDGRENWKDGQPHFHYISSAFGVAKEDFIQSMKTGQYKSTSIHIDLLEYGNQPTKKTDSN